jgi:hypothetical protein
MFLICWHLRETAYDWGYVSCTLVAALALAPDDIGDRVTLSFLC